jgi:hypothetical protein
MLSEAGRLGEVGSNCFNLRLGVAGSNGFMYVTWLQVR